MFPYAFQYALEGKHFVVPDSGVVSLQWDQKVQVWTIFAYVPNFADGKTLVGNDKTSLDIMIANERLAAHSIGMVTWILESHKF